MQPKLISTILGSFRKSENAPAPSPRSEAPSTVRLTTEEAANLTLIREEEKLARDTYLALFNKWGNIVFSKIASSEQAHMDAILGLLQHYGLPDPAAGNAPGKFTNPKLQALYSDLTARGLQSELEALKVGGLIEETDIRDLKTSIANTSRPDILKVYENLFCGSRNHLRAFSRTIGPLISQPYTAMVLTQAEVDAIVNTPMERCS